ncbi:FAD-binding oxidoreductase [Streptomyces sp. GC420]|uniref:FAD-binding oxidoreductase n=1 Tax=Streptomyces sp. GC420 TaxID=2697568 RepID=UPI001414CCE3|nr:FAD-binding oxidoreductase [Streptomyces sp. GC420]NBM17054.1 FAD-binding protein [Streptomyces sp. GC420]
MSTATNPLTTGDLDRLKSGFAGPVFVPGDPGMSDEAAPFNRTVSHRPLVVAAATRVEDVVHAVRWAAARELPIAVQATGHGAVAPADGGLLVTTRRMDEVTVDAARRTVRVAAGARWKSVIAAAAEHGLAPLSGSSSDVGAIGYTLGGGHGILGRQYGFAADHVLAVDLVTADGRLRQVTAESEPELFWAVRGGKGSFGVVTAMEIRLFPVITVYAGGIFFAGSSASGVLHAYRAWAPTLPEQASSSVALLRLPPLEELPEPLRGRFVVHLRFAYNGPAEEGEALLAPMRTAGEAVLDHVGELPYTATDSVHQDPKDPMPVWNSGMLLRSIEAETVEALVGAVGPEADVPLAMVEIRQLGGALSRPASPPNAVSGREGAYGVSVVGALLPGIEEAVPAAGNAVLGALEPWAAHGALINFLGETSPEQLAGAWDPQARTRLLEIKRAYDPARLFRLGHAIGA